MPFEPYNGMYDILLGYDTDIHFENGDLMLTNGIDFIQREIYKLLITEPGEWAADPDLGASPNKFTGEQNTRETANKVEQWLKDKLQLTVSPAQLSVRAIPTSTDKLMIFLEIYSPDYQNISMNFEFDYIKGFKKLPIMDARVTKPKSDKHQINDINHLKRPNKYWSRLSQTYQTRS